MLFRSLEGKHILLSELLAWIRQKPQPHLVEGVGGWEVPISSEFRVSDLAKELGYPVVLVASDVLGVLNHCLLTAEAIRKKGLRLAAIVLVEPAQKGLATSYNAEDLRMLLGVEVVAFPRVHSLEEQAAAGAKIWEVLNGQTAQST